MAQQRVRVEGLRELERSLLELSKATARNTLRRTLTKAGETIADAARYNVPVGTGNLRDSITVTRKAPVNGDVGKAAFAAAMRSGLSQGEAGQAARAARRENPDTFARVWVGPGRHPQAITQEFGTYFHPAQPFMRPAWDSRRYTALDIIQRDLAADIDKAVQRVRARAVRAAARAQGRG